MQERRFVKSVLAGTRAKRRWGQNFLVDEAIADRIVESSGISRHDVCLEIGAGLGVLTERLNSLARRVVAVEIDKRLCDLLRERIRHDGLVIIPSDVLRLDLCKVSSDFGVHAFRVISNLPYGSATQIIFWLIGNRRWISDAVLMVQREVAERLTAAPASKAYGVTTLKVGYYATLQVLFGVGRKSFLPEPKVDSTVLKMRLRSKPALKVADEGQLFKLIDSGFRKRRKMLRNCLRADFAFTNDELQRLEASSGIDLERRGETLTLEEFGLLSETMMRIDRE